MRIFIISLVTFLGISVLPNAAWAASLSMEPTIVDVSGQRREEFRFVVSVTNRGPGVANAYPVVAEVNTETGELSVRGTPAGGSQFASTWLSLQRDNLYLVPGQTKEVNVTAKLNVIAEPGIYHAVIVFVDADSPDEAKALAGRQVSRTMVNFEVKTDAVEQLNLVSFLTPQRILFGFPAVLQATILNGGNSELAPEGRVRILNRDSEELWSEPFNMNATTVPENGEVTIDTSWSGDGGFGRYKAVLEMQYGNVTDNIVADSTVFWVIPVWLIAALVGAAILVVTLLVHLIHRRAIHHAKHS